MKKRIACILIAALLICGLSMAVSAGSDELSAKLLAEYNFDNQTTNDSVGANHATFYNNADAAAATYEDGISGKGLKLSTKGTDEKFWLSIPYSVFGDSRDSFTLSLWYKASGYNTSGEDSELFSLYNSANERFLFYSPAAVAFQDKGFAMKWDGTYGSANVISGYKENEWTHLVFAVDAVDGQSKITAYINGAAVEVDQSGAWANSLMSQLGVDTFTIGGKNPYKGGPTPNCLFYGTVDEIRLYKGALNADEAKAIYDETTAQTPIEDDQLKILMIGNSYIVDSATYLWDICANGGLKNPVVSYAWIPDSGITDHWNNIQSGAAAYEYQKNTSGNFAVTTGVPLLSALKDEDWDVIVFMPGSAHAGVTDSQIHIADIVSWLDAQKTNPGAKIYWNMTWAYPEGSKEPLFELFGRDQMTMYNANIAYAQNYVQSIAAVDGVIPVGTAIQNLRTSYLGDTLCRDNIHLSYDYGRYIAALTCYAYITGGDISQITWTPGDHTYISNDFDAIREAVKESLENPGSVSRCDVARNAARGDLLGEWNFNDSTTKDSLGKYDAAFYNDAAAAAAAFGDGVSGKALKLSTQGTDEKYWLNIPYSVFGGSRDSFTLSLWYNATGHNTAGEESELFSLYSGTENFLFYGAHFDGSQDAFTMKWDGTHGYANAIGGYKENEWVHLVFAVDAVDGESRITAYINGEPVEVDQGGEWANSLMTDLGINHFTVGGKNPFKGGSTPNCLFYGMVDEIRLYAGVLNADEAKAIYEEVQTTEPDPQPTDPQPTDPQPTDPQPTDPQPTDPQPTDPQPTDPQPTDPQPTDPQPTDPQPSEGEELPAMPEGLLAYYDFNNSLKDSVGGQNASLFNGSAAASPAFVNGISGSALKLSTQGTDEKFWLSIPYSVFGSSKDSFTLSIWYQASGYNTSGEDSELFSFYNSTKENFLFYGPAAVAFQDKGFTMKWDGNYGYANIITPYTQNQWVHLVYAVSTEGNKTVITAYVNGEPVEVDQGGDWSSSLMSLLGIDTFTVGGKNPYKGDTGCTFYGCVDEIRLYSGALNASQAQAIYKNALHAAPTPDAPHPDTGSNPGTGDFRDPALGIALMAASCVVVTVMVTRKKRETA